jgi:cellulose biosynthesis protein BcsQ
VSRVVTFYSFKGGVGRSMAMANVAVLLVRRGLRVLAVDWDLEAPGLERYFDAFEVSVKRGGLLPLLVEQHAVLSDGGPRRPDAYRGHLWQIGLGGEHPLSLLTSGRAIHGDYARILEQFSWRDFFSVGGGDFLEGLRDLWRDDYDVVLLDSRTGMSDAGGICTIQMPDVLVAMFTANYQSIFGVRDVVESARSGRQRLAYDRTALTVLPVPSRFTVDAGAEAVADEWLERFSTELGPCFRDWLPRGVSPKGVLERLAIPHCGQYALGERLATVDDSGRNPGGLSTIYGRIADLIASDFANAEKVLGELPREKIEARVPTLDRPAITERRIDPGESVGDYDYDVLVSYARTGGSLDEWTRGVVAELRVRLTELLGRPVTFWLDQLQAEVGVPIAEEIVSRVRRSRVCLAIVTPRYVASSSCLLEWREFEAREHGDGVPLICPVMVRGATLPEGAGEREWLDATDIDVSRGTTLSQQRLVWDIAHQLADLLRSRPDEPVDGLLQESSATSAPSQPSGQGQEPLATVEPSLSVLVVPANSSSPSELDLQAETRAIEEALRRSPFRDAARVHSRWAETIDELVEATFEAAPAVLHFSGQGTSEGLFVRGPGGLPQVLSVSRLETLLRITGAVRRATARLIVLSGCFGETLARELTRIVEVVVGTTPHASDSQVRAFPAQLYVALAAGQSVGFAFELALVAATLEAHDARIVVRDGIDPNAVFLLARASDPPTVAQEASAPVAVSAPDTAAVVAHGDDDEASDRTRDA